MASDSNADGYFYTIDYHKRILEYAVVMDRGAFLNFITFTFLISLMPLFFRFSYDGVLAFCVTVLASSGAKIFNFSNEKFKNYRSLLYGVGTIVIAVSTYYFATYNNAETLCSSPFPFNLEHPFWKVSGLFLATFFLVFYINFANKYDYLSEVEEYFNNKEMVKMQKLAEKKSSTSDGEKI